MKRIDLHIHTIATEKDDSSFQFSKEKLQEYVNIRKIDAIAITNHNVFDPSGFGILQSEITNTVIFPGIEIDIEGAHILVISDRNDIQDFSEKCLSIHQIFSDKRKDITFEEFIAVFKNIDKYLIIPHFNKKPSISPSTLSKFGTKIFCGEVSNENKFERLIKDDCGITPVLFSDCRLNNDTDFFSTKQTILDIDNLTLVAIKECLKDKSKTFLNEEKCREQFYFLGNNLKASTGLNVILGKRSTGKTYTLEKISKLYKNVKYIRQFQLIEKDKESEDKKFSENISMQKSLYTEEYLTEFKSMVDEIISITKMNASLNNVDVFLESLKNIAKEQEKSDIFSKAKIFNEPIYNERDLSNLNNLISAIELLLNQELYKNVIDKHINRIHLINLLRDLIRIYRDEFKVKEIENRINPVLKLIKKQLELQSSTKPLPLLDLVSNIKKEHKIQRFIEIVKEMQRSKFIKCEPIGDYYIVAKIRKFENATDLKGNLSTKISLVEAFKNYSNPYIYLNDLIKAGIAEADIYKCFVKVEYEVKNKYFANVSGGERAEFNLYNELEDASNFDMLLIDELESSFDNPFLKRKINETIKLLSQKMPVFISTHNNTVGASIKADFIIYTEMKVNSASNEPIFEVYSGRITDKELTNNESLKIKTNTILLDCLEAGDKAYEERRLTYDATKI